MVSSGATLTLASYVRNADYDDLPAPVVAQAKHLILDSIGCTLGGYQAPKSDVWIGLAEGIGGGISQSTIIGRGSRVSTPAAAFCNSSLSVIFDYVGSFAMGHSVANVGGTAIPAALAVAEWKKATGRELINAVVASYEVASRLARAIQLSPAQFQKLRGPAFGVFAAAAAAAKLLGGTEDEVLSALGMSGVLSPVLAAWKYIGEGCRPMREIKHGLGWQSMTGVFVAQAAIAGLSMTQPSNILDGKRGFWVMIGADKCDFKKMRSGLGEEYLIMQNHFKKFPGSSETHPSLYALEKVLGENSIRPDTIERITLRVHTKGHFDTYVPEFVDAQFSTLYQATMMALGNPPGPAWYRQRSLDDPRVKDMLSRIRVRYDQALNKEFHASGVKPVIAEIQTKDGRKISERFDDPGWSKHSASMISHQEVVRKFENQTRDVLGRSQVARIKESVLELDKMKDVSVLFPLLAKHE